MTKRPKSSAKMTTIIGKMEIPMHAIKSITTFLDHRAVLPGEMDDPELKGADPDVVRKVCGNELVIVVDLMKLQEKIQFTEYFRTRQSPRKR